MRLILNTYINAVLFGSYQVLMMILLGVSVFFEPNRNELYFYLLSFLFLVLLNLTSSIILDKLTSSFSVKRIARVIGYFISVSLFAFIVLPFYIQQEDTMIIGFALFISSLLPSMMILWDLYVEYLSSQLNITIEGTTNDSIDKSESEKKVEFFTLRNKSGKEIFSKPLNSILFFEANDNYTNIYFKDDDSLKKHMERLSLKKIEELIDTYSKSFFRVHKSFIINPSYLKEITGRSQAYKLKITSSDKLIPVSRNFDIDLLSPYLS